MLIIIIIFYKSFIIKAQIKRSQKACFASIHFIF